MKNSCNLSKLIVVIAQLFLLGGCYSFNKSENPPSIDIASLQEPDKKCLEVLKQGLEKYKDITAKLDTIDITNNQSAPQPISSRAKNLSSDLQKLIGAKECQPPASTESVSNVIAQVKELDTEVLLMADALKNKQKIKEKVNSFPSQTSTPIKKDSDNDQKTKQKEDKEKSTQVYDGQDRVIKEVRDVDNINRSSTDTFTAEKSSQQVYVAQQLTYDIAFQCYQNGSYESLQSYSQGYYSATPESMMRNRAYWGNPIELVQSYDGLFWIIKTIDSHCMLFPNPDKRIEQTRIMVLNISLKLTLRMKIIILV